MAGSDIQPKAVAIKRIQNFINIDTGNQTAIASDESMLKIVKAVPSEYLAGFRAVTLKDVSRARVSVRELYRMKVSHLHRLVSTLLTKPEKVYLTQAVADGMHGKLIDSPEAKALDSAEHKLGL